MVDRETFNALVHDALAHLYDLPFLEKSPLAGLLDLHTGGGGGTRLHRALVDGIERLKPPREVAPDSVAWKLYRSLFLRYIRSLNAGTTAHELGLSVRQAQRIHLAALASIAALLWEEHQSKGVSAVPGNPRPDSRSVVQSAQCGLDEELATVLAGARDELEAFPSIIQSALSTAEPMLARFGIVTAIDVDPALAHRIAPRGLTRQALVQLILSAVDLKGVRRLALVARNSAEAVQLRIAVESSEGTSSAASESAIEWHLHVAQRLLNAIGSQVVVRTAPQLEIDVVLPLRITPTVLAVEDNPQIVQLFRRYLHGTIYQLVHLADPEEVVNWVIREPPDAITLDVMMPRRDGWEVLQMLQVRPETRRIPVIVCSVLRDRDLALALGAADFLPKPITRDALLDALDRYVMKVRPLTAVPET